MRETLEALEELKIKCPQYTIIIDREIERIKEEISIIIDVNRIRFGENNTYIPKKNDK